MSPDRPTTDASLFDGDDVDAESRYYDVNGVTLHAVTAGDESDPLVVLLHGFPEFWYEWHEYLAPLVDAGFHVVVPDQRGYNRSEKPEGVRAYRRRELAHDVVDLVAAAGHDSAHVVGHDWGALVTWDVALRHPDVVERITVINVPHPTVFEAALTSNLRQMRKSWYLFFFQLPRVPEWFQRRNDFETLIDGFRTATSETFTEDDFDRYRAAWSREGALRGMLHWYRALFRHRDDPPRERVDAPTLVIWGEKDQYLLPELAPKSVEYCADGRLERRPDATHWIPHEQPEYVSRRVLDHLRE